MKVLTFGWEFPPAQSGGLGFACQGLTEELLHEGVEVTFVLPKTQDSPQGRAKFLYADQERWIKIRQADLGPLPYENANNKVDVIVGYDSTGKPIIKSRTIIEEAHRFAHQASIIAREEDFDVIHAHDWTSYLAGIAAKIATGKPLVLHVHATSFDQAASDNVDPAVFKIEKEGFEMADKVVTVSGYTKEVVVHKHGVPEEKVEVVHNGCHTEDLPRHEPALAELKRQGKKIVLYVGRITIQKGVDYFVHAARKVVDIDPNTVFVICGSGDMTNQIIEMVGSLGLSKNFIFTGALWFDDRDRLMQSVDLVVMPSVSEPFGLVPFEALQNGTPSIISKQSGAAEVLSHALKVDFWDVDEMANQILSSLRYPTMRHQLVKEGKWQMVNMSWRHAAAKVKRLYQNLVQYVAT